VGRDRPSKPKSKPEPRPESEPEPRPDGGSESVVGTFADAREDVLVAAAAAGCTVALALASAGFGIDASPVIQLAPLAVYFGYLFTKDTPLGSVGYVAWSAASALVALATFAYLLL